MLAHIFPLLFMPITKHICTHCATVTPPSPWPLDLTSLYRFLEKRQAQDVAIFLCLCRNSLHFQIPISVPEALELVKNNIPLPRFTVRIVLGGKTY